MSEQNQGPDNPYGQPASAPPPNPYGSSPGYGSSSGDAPSPYGGYGQPSGSPYGADPGYGAYSTPETAKRPGTVTAAAVLTWVTCALTALLFGFLMIVIAGGSDEIVTEIERQPGFEDLNVSADDLIGVVQGFLGFLIFCCLVGALLAVLAFRRSNIGRILLVVWAGLAALLSLLLVASGITLVTLLAAVAVIVLLFMGGANQWYARQ